MENRKRKIEPENNQIQKIINEASDETIRAENINKEFEHKGDIFGRGIKQISEVDPELQKTIYRADLELLKKFIEKLTKKDIDFDEKMGDLKRFQNSINIREASIIELKKRINAGGILPVKKEDLKRQLEGLEKIQEIERNYADLASAELESVAYKEYKKPKSIGENIIKN